MTVPTGHLPVGKVNMSTKFDFETALDGPAAAFGTPEALMQADSLSDEEKVRLLRRWEFDAREEAVAVEEGMPNAPPAMEHSGPDMLSRVLKALQSLTGEEQGEQAGPSKHGGA